ncbi:hypothetical protein C0989_009345 [Termitomyces sp. Mn162]|nr:hypothetical protein C0989_009345 [Termitomyces sp. Mn162]
MPTYELCAHTTNPKHSYNNSGPRPSLGPGPTKSYLIPHQTPALSPTLAKPPSVPQSIYALMNLSLTPKPNANILGLRLPQTTLDLLRLLPLAPSCKSLHSTPPPER